jgi:predicted PurR-regulated permease PerM
MSYKKFQIYFFIGVLILSIVLSLAVFRSYLTMLALGGVLAIVSRPLFRKLDGFMKSDAASAFLTMLIMALILVLPTAYFFAALASELVQVIGNARTYFDPTSIAAVLEKTLPPVLRDQVPAVLTESQRLLSGIASGLATKLLGFFSNIVTILLGFFVMLVAAYYLIKDGPRIKKSLLSLSPLGDQYDELVFQRVTMTVRAVVGGVLILGLLKGVLASAAFWAVGIPAPLFWGIMTGLASFIPVLGTALVTVPAIIFLLLNGHLVSAIILAVISGIVIGGIDNVLQPKLVQSKTNIHPLLVLLSMLGGIEFYGFAGFIIGPLTLAVTMSLIDIYRLEFRNYLSQDE